MTMIPPSLPAAPAQTPVSPTPLPSGRSLRASAEALEASFLAEMFKSAGFFQPAESMGGGEGEAQFTSFLADAQAKAMVANGGLGLADSIEQALRLRAGLGQP